MKTIFTFVFACSISLLGTGGCKKHDATPATMGTGSASGSAAMTGSASTTGSAGSATMMTGSAAAMGSAVAPDLPTAADFETQAANDITDKNLESQLDKVEKDLGK